ncbi:MAG: triose-phosphate isomerase [Amoebophilaceae bacterium]|nr:triose-phosphate isomerase [Amoebophilaceae bacterium]
MKKQLIGNWKMHKTVQEATDFMEQLSLQIKNLELSGIHLSIAPAFIHLFPLHQLTALSPSIRLIAQNCHHEKEGAFTGEVSAAMLASTGIEGVLIGHSERRAYQQEDHGILVKKIKSVLAAGMSPIFCCGEQWADRAQGNHEVILQQQLSLPDLTEVALKKLIIAYEPVWAIGSGKVATVEVIAATHSYIRELLRDRYGSLGENVPILYGGSCNEENARDIFACSHVAGGLIGNASLQVDRFIKIIHALLNSK